MDHLVLHDTTRQQLANYAASPSHAVLIAGSDGIGKTAIAEALLAQLLRLDHHALTTHPYYLQLTPEGQSISIEAIRGLQKFLQLKTPGTQMYRRAILIEHADRLTLEAQNAYLKLLEEPPADTVMVLTAASPRALLPTIMSRLQTIMVHPPNEEALQAIIAASSKDDAARTQAYFLSGGLPGLLAALLHDEAHPLLASVTTAKALLQKSPFERLAMVDALSKQKDSAVSVLAALHRIAQTMLLGASAKQDLARLKQWHHIRKCVLEAQEALARSANAKLTLDHLFLSI